MNKKRWLALGVFLFLFVSYFTVGAWKQEDKDLDLSLNDYLFASNSWEEATYKSGSGSNLALLKVEGIIVENTSEFARQGGYNHRVFLDQLQTAFERDDIKGIVLFIDSPGGGVFESDEIYNKIVELKKMYDKPLLVSMGKITASGGYYISAPADKIYSNRNTLTGSIGVIMSSYNFSELANNLGIYEQVYKSGKHKDIMSPMRKTTPEENAIMQGIIDESFNFFVDVVASGRNLDREKVLEIADGRIYTGTQAQKIGLVDELGDLDDAIEGAATLAEIENPNVLIFNTIGPSKLEKLLNIRSSFPDIQGIKEKFQTPSLMYICR